MHIVKGLLFTSWLKIYFILGSTIWYNRKEGYIEVRDWNHSEQRSLLIELVGASRFSV